jgi:NAD(P)-dependent dehydrogenase (short-subunit alcohol dehydrogenase family)
LDGMRLKDKKAIVTGAGRGIGRAVALAFAREGADVVVNYQSNDAAAKETVEAIQALGRKAIPVKTDVSNYADVKAMVDRALKEFGGLDILVNNAGLSKPAMLLDMPEESWDRVVNIRRLVRNGGPDQLCFSQGRDHWVYEIGLQGTGSVRDQCQCHMPGGHHDRHD